MHPDFDKNEIRPDNDRFEKMIVALMSHPHEEPEKQQFKRQFRRPGEFKPDPISLHGFHEISYLTPQNIHTVTDLFGFDYGGELPDSSTAGSLPAGSKSSIQPLLQLPSVHKYTDPLLPSSSASPEVSAISTVLPSTEHLLAASRQPVATLVAPSGLQAFLKRPLVQGITGLAVGIGFLVIVARLVDIPRTIHLIQQNVTTTRGLVFALLASLSFVLAFCLRALRWKLFLNPVGKVRTPNVIALFLIGVFLNFVLPIRAGELAKSLILRRTANIHVHQSLPTITMDKVMDLLPAFFIIAVVPFLGVKLDSRFWMVLGMANAVLLSAIVFVFLTAWKRTLMMGLLKRLTGFLPGALATKIQHFAIGFVDSLLMSVKNPRTLFLAVLLTMLAVVCDGLYNFFGFWTIGYPITFGSAIFGYMVFNMFYILPNPPGQVGSNEIVGLLIFTGMLHVPPDRVTAMIVLFHLWSGILMCAMGMISLSSLGVKFSSMVKMQTKGESEITSL
jgi:uncharacterized protein (TIRG00374 family)